MNALKALIKLSSIAQVLIAIWLVSVLFLILPHGNADQIPLWSFVTVGFAAYGILSLLSIQGSVPWFRPIMLGAGPLAIALGIWMVVGQFLRASSNKDFEGYLVLMGLALAGHGLLTLLFALQTRIKKRKTAQS